MKVFTVTNFPGFYRVGFASLIVAKDEKEAARLFERAVVLEGLPLTDRVGIPFLYSLEEVPMEAHCTILVNGKY